MKSLLALGTHCGLISDLLAFLERLESGRIDRREVRKQVFATVIRADEAKPLRIVESLHRTSCHVRLSIVDG